MLMTVHSAKGLEFQNVFLVGMEQGVFPGNRSLDSGKIWKRNVAWRMWHLPVPRKS